MRGALALLAAVACLVVPAHGLSPPRMALLATLAPLLLTFPAGSGLESSEAKAGGKASVRLFVSWRT
jgi:hypothetical protein